MKNAKYLTHYPELRLNWEKKLVKSIQVQVSTRKYPNPDSVLAGLPKGLSGKLMRQWSGCLDIACECQGSGSPFALEAIWAGMVADGPQKESTQGQISHVFFVFPHQIPAPLLYCLWIAVSDTNKLAGHGETEMAYSLSAAASDLSSQSLSTCGDREPSPASQWLAGPVAPCPCLLCWEGEAELWVPGCFHTAWHVLVWTPCGWAPGTTPKPRLTCLSSQCPESLWPSCPGLFWDHWKWVCLEN